MLSCIAGLVDAEGYAHSTGILVFILLLGVCLCEKQQGLLPYATNYFVSGEHTALSKQASVQAVHKEAGRQARRPASKGR